MAAQTYIDYEFADEPDEELEAERVQPDQFDGATVHSTDWTTETILNQLERKNIDLSPRFQRRDAWSESKKSRFIESLILGLPVPQIVLAERKEGRGRFFVLDGKQRLLTLLQFSGNADGTKYNNFALHYLDVLVGLDGLGYKDLSEDPALRKECDAFSNQTIRTVVVRNWPSVEYLHLLFLRLNTSSVPLSPQELRQAVFPGPFVDYVDDFASESELLMQVMKNSEPDFRMRDVEIVVRYFAFSWYLDTYSGNLSEFLDDTCKRLNADWATNRSAIQRHAASLNDALAVAETIFGMRYVGRKWTSRGYEPRLNRAILDVILFYFRSPQIADVARAKPGDVEQAFKDLCLESEAFRAAVESTTKSLRATFDRVSLWGQRLETILHTDVAVPTWDVDANRIRYAGAGTL